MKKQCNHKKKLDYSQWHFWAEKQLEKGIKQKICAKCKLWLFPSEL